MALRAEPVSKAQRLAPFGLPSLTRLTEPHRAGRRAGARRLRPLAWSVRSLANQAAPASLNAMDEWVGTANWNGVSGPFP